MTAGRLARVAPWRGVLVFNYHRVGTSDDSPWDRGMWSATGEALDEQLRFLARHFDVIGPEDLEAALNGPAGTHVMLTFDDGYRDNYEIAYPLLRAHGLTAAFFLTSGFLDAPSIGWWDEIAWMARTSSRSSVPAGRWLDRDLSLAGPDRDQTIWHLVTRYKGLPAEQREEFLEFLAEACGTGRCDARLAEGMWMTWDMAREMAAGGMTIGGHTVTHPILSGLSRAEQGVEIGTCARRLREELGQTMSSFSYPVGHRGSFDEDTRAVLRDEGVRVAFSFYGGYSRPKDWDPFDVRRVAVGTFTSRQRFQAMTLLPQRFARG